MKFWLKLLLILGFLGPILVVNTSTQAAGASLFLSPAGGTKYVGDKFNVSVYVGTTQSANTFDVYLSTSNLTVTGISIGGSICILHPTPPSFNNISARFRCGLPTPGFTGSGGYIGYIAVRGNAPGQAKIFVDANSQVLANDGSGSNILTSRGTATYTIQPPPTAAPSITSTTHPDQDKWYKSNSPNLSWTGNGSTYSWELTQNPDTTPDQSAEGGETSKTFNSLEDGTWYFHVRVRGSNGVWSATSHYRLQIDTVPPEKFTPEADPKNNAEKLPIIAFNTTDKTSGLDHYELRVGEKGTWEKVENPYKLPKITSGKHTIFVKAVDKAGNEQIGSVDITVKDIAPPIITLPENNSILTYGTDLVIKGSSFPGYSVKIYLDGKEIAVVKVGQDGKFEFVYKELLRAGQHELYAVAANLDQIESPPSVTVKFQVDPKAYVILGHTVPGAFVTLGVGLLIIFFVLVILFLFLGGKRMRKKLQKVLEELEEKVEEELTSERVSRKVREKVEEDFEEAEEEVGK